MDEMLFGPLVRSYRQRLLLTQEQLAERAKMGVRSIRGIESGEVRSPRMRSVGQLAGALELSELERRSFEATSRTDATGSIGDALGTRTAPAQESAGASLLPPDIADFTGRDDLVIDLVEVLAGEEAQTSSLAASVAVAVVSLAGRAGVGKTALAVHVAHRLRPRFPQGQLYVNLRGAHRDPLHPSEVLDRFLRALGHDGATIPPGMEERAERYRGLLADREVLVVLDNAASEAQVRPLLPGGPTCAVLVTSRVRLSALEGAHLVELDALDRPQAVGLLARIVGEDRVLAEPKAAEAIVGWCARLPLAVRIAGAKLAARSHWSLGRLEGLLADELRRLDELTAGDLEVRASVALSYDALADQQRAAFRRLALLHAPDFAGWVAAALLDVATGQGEQIVEGLVQAQLLDPAGNGADGQPRYRFHDLLRVYARERARLEEPAEQLDEALSRAFGAWLGLAEQADQLLPNGSSVVSHGNAPRRRLDQDREAALLAQPVAWMEAERLALVAAVEQSSSSEAPGMDELAWDLATSISAFFELRGYFDHWHSTNEMALATTRRTNNRRGQIAALINLAESKLEHDRTDEASPLIEEASQLAGETGDEVAYAHTLYKFSLAERLHGRFLVALRFANEAVAAFTRIGDDRHLGYSLYERGSSHLELNSSVEAEVDLTRALMLQSHVADERARAQVLRRLAMVQLERGKLDLAGTHLERCLELCQDIQDAVGEAYVLETLGRVWLRRGHPGRASTLLDRAYHQFQRVGVLRGQGLTLRTMGELHAAQDQRHQALSCMREAMEIWRQLDVPAEFDRTQRLLEELGLEALPRR